MTKTIKAWQLNEREQIEVLLEALEVLADELDPRMPFQQLLVFIHSAAECMKSGAIDMADIQERTGLSSASTSRNVSALGMWHRLQKPGLGVLNAEEDLADRRRKPVVLTPKGMKVIQRCNAAMQRVVRTYLKRKGADEIITQK